MVVVTCVGRLRAKRIRHADAENGAVHDGCFEIVSLSGTMDPNHQHLHILIADREGKVFGGHLLPDSEIYAMAEVVALILPELRFGRTRCERSGYDELTITRRRAEA